MLNKIKIQNTQRYDMNNMQLQNPKTPIHNCGIKQIWNFREKHFPLLSTKSEVIQQLHAFRLYNFCHWKLMPFKSQEQLTQNQIWQTYLIPVHFIHKHYMPKKLSKAHTFHAQNTRRKIHLLNIQALKGRKFLWSKGYQQTEL